MDVRCERCKTQYQLDDSRVSETGVTVQCSTCHHVFVVKKKALVVTVPVAAGQQPQGPAIPLGTPPAPPPPGLRPLGSPITMPPPVGTAAAPPPAEAASVLPPGGTPGERAREWRVRQASGNLFTLKDLTTLQKWIVERKVSRDDEISMTGESWKRLGDIGELATFFQLVDEAQKAAVLQAQLGATASTAAPAPEPSQKRSLTPVLLLLLVLLLGGGSAFYYFQVLVPQREEAERVATARRLEEEERRERERQEQLLAAQARAETQAQADAGSPTEPDADAGALAGAELLDAGDGGSQEDAGTLLDAGAAEDAGTGADAGTPDAGAPDAGTGVKRPAPVRDFDYYMTQGDRQRERERPEAALEAYAAAAELSPDRGEAYAGRGMAFLDLGDTRQAEAEFKQALKFNPRYGEAIIGLAETYRSQGKKAEAIRYYERYLEILPNGPEAAVARTAIERLKE
ncbi:zinc-ribbon domain-containing protein [Hyalangium rubrum]|uniref:Zinc-ribbon domain-containing protein n=1 Tax=Hyalangium rubrum TaxID=3103134 RepID=A0ABU5H6W7_9BACT|nr:zinc-ribbon domain-containing protein [Hyalangium sp. s54d21]MDY7229219.1 zinc-ribbon domain-containing protein [Hyalangium sp. s54d21]